MHSGNVFTELSIVLVIATIVSLIVHRLKQPLIIGYILTGIIVGPFLLNLANANEAFDTFSQIGITLLLFIIGLELSVTVVRRMGKTVLLTALTLLLSIGTVGFLVGTAFHFTQTEALLTGFCLFFSSTIIIAKVLSDKKELGRLNGQIAIGVILIDDVVATIALLFVASQSNGSLDAIDILLLAAKGIGVVLGLFLVGTKVLPHLIRYIAKSQELLFIFALAWGFGIAALVNFIGFSVEVGALFAGVTLAHLPYARQIAAKLKPLRDFFIIIFFISLGKGLELSNLRGALLPAAALSAIVLFIKPLVTMASLGFMRYTKRTSFKAAINLSQISEFSIILVVLAAGSGLVSGHLSAIITLVALITIAISTYLMKYDDAIYARIQRALTLFERSKTTEAKHTAKVYPLILFGYNGGQQFLKTFKSMSHPFVVVDYDPDVIDELEHKHIEYLYGDATDPEILDEISFEQAKLIVNTIDDHDVNVTLLNHVRQHSQEAVVICYSTDHTKAAELYRLGASYVMLPHFIGTQQLNSFLQENGFNKQSFAKYRKHHLVEIGRIAVGNS